MHAAKYGRLITTTDAGDNFMAVDRFYDDRLWADDVKDYFRHVDELPAHFHSHLYHGAEILGYKHPDPFVRSRWHQFYVTAVDDLHLVPETEEMMDARLSDWNRDFWDEG